MSPAVAAILAVVCAVLLGQVSKDEVWLRLVFAFGCAGCVIAAVALS